MRHIAASATVDPKCELGDHVEIGPGCVIGAGARIGEGCRLMPNVVVMGNTTLGPNNLLYPGCVVGLAPQDLKHSGEDTQLRIGEGNVFREHVTVHVGTALGGGITQIGDHNQFQIGSHIAHDVLVGNHCVMSNGVQVAGHVHIEDHVNIAGMTGIHQFVTLGRYSFIAAMARCTTDVPPFLIISYDGTLAGVNVKGLARWGFTDDQCANLKKLYRQLFPRHGREDESRGPKTLLEMLFSRRARRGALSLSTRIAEAESNGALDDHCKYLVQFLKRSMTDGKYGRYLESVRRDTNTPPPQFYAEAARVSGATL